MAWTAGHVTPVQLRILLAVADHGGFTAAAERIGSTQPSVSRAISALERELGATLFARHREGIAATEAGSIAIHHARQALASLERLEQEVTAVSGRINGTLRIASLPSATGSLLATPLRAFTDRHPALTVRLFEGTDQEVRDWLTRGAADLGIVTLPADGYEYTELGGDEMVAVLPAAHPLAGRSTVSLDALTEECFILPTGGCGPLILDAARRKRATLHIAYEAREPQSLLEMVAAGLGITVMPTLNIPARLDGITTRQLEPRLPRTLAVAIGADVGPPAHAFFDELANRRHSLASPPRGRQRGTTRHDSRAVEDATVESRR
jgi:DNA-binding transcriptional LysR family regulator